MKGLLLKDWYMLRKTLLLYAVVCVAMQAAPGGGQIISMMYASMLPMSAFAYDDRSRWGDLAAMLPYSVREIVLSRYLVGWIGIVCMDVVSILSQTVMGKLLPELQNRVWYGGASGFLTMLGFSTLFLALTMPVQFRFDAEKSRLFRWLTIAIIAGAVGAGLAVAGIEQTFSESGAADVMATWPGICALAAVLTAVSVPASMWAYRARRK